MKKVIVFIISIIIISTFSFNVFADTYQFNFMDPSVDGVSVIASRQYLCAFYLLDPNDYGAGTPKVLFYVDINSPTNPTSFDVYVVNFFNYDVRVLGCRYTRDGAVNFSSVYTCPANSTKTISWNLPYILDGLYIRNFISNERFQYIPNLDVAFNDNIDYTTQINSIISCCNTLISQD